MVDHEILLQRLHSCFGVTGRVMAWIRSYLHHQTQFVRLGSRRSCLWLVPSGVPQGSVLGPNLFMIYAADLLRVIKHHGFYLHLYADDTHVYDFCSLSSTDQLQLRLSDCTDDVACWMRSNQLQLNTQRTDVMRCTSKRCHQLLPSDLICIGSDSVTPSYSVHDLGIYLYSNVSMRIHVIWTMSKCFGMLCQLRTIRRSVPADTFQGLVVFTGSVSIRL